MNRLTPSTEFQNNSKTEWFERFKDVTHNVMRKPSAIKLQALNDYMSKFDESTIERFFDTLGKSIWVRNSNFNIEMVIRKDLVNTLLAGVDGVVSKYYDIQVVVITE